MFAFRKKRLTGGNGHRTRVQTAEKVRNKFQAWRVRQQYLFASGAQSGKTAANGPRSSIKLRKSAGSTFALALFEEQEDTLVRRQFGTPPQHVDKRFSADS